MTVVNFLNGTGSDPRGKTFDDVLSQDDAWLEQEHDYIQWLFPLLEESAQVHDAPVLTPEDVNQLRTSREAVTNQQLAVQRMLNFYGFNDHWITATDHNHLRITRILKSVRLLQSLEAAEAIYNILMEQVHRAGNPIDAKNITYWTDAVGLSYILRK
jgi:hypothetical protein